MKGLKEKMLEKVLDDPKLLGPAVSTIATYSFGLKIYDKWKKYQEHNKKNYGSAKQL